MSYPNPGLIERLNSSRKQYHPLILENGGKFRKFSTSIAATAKWTNSLAMKWLRKDVEGICQSLETLKLKNASKL